MVDDDVVEDLMEIGLTEYQSRAYVAAVTLGTADFSSMAEESGIPRQRIYDVVYSLGDLGLIEVREGLDGKQVSAPSPEAVMEEFKARRMEEVAERYDRVAEELEHHHDRVEAESGFVTVVSHQSTIERHARNAIEEAQWWLFLSLDHGLYEAVAEAVRAAVDRGTTVRLLFQDEGSRATVDALDFPDGLTIRRRPGADTVVAADREYGLFRGLAAPPVTRPTLVTGDENIVEMLQRYSEQFWAASREVSAGGGLPRRYLSPRQALVDVEEWGRAPEDLLVRVDGHTTADGRRGSWEGRLLDYELRAYGDADFSVVLPDVARLEIDAEEGPLSVGGWDATLEDVAAHGIELDET